MIRRTGKLFIELLAALAAGLMVITAIVAWRLWSGPISLDFLTPYIEDALQAEDGSYRVKLDRTVLTWAGWQRTLDIRAQGVETRNADGVLLARIPELSVSLSARALAAGDVAPTSLEIIGARMALQRKADGTVDLELGEAGAGADQSDLLALFVGELMRPPEEGRVTGYLTRVSILGADLAIDDRLWDVRWRARLGQLTLERDVLGVRTRVALEIDAREAVARFEAVGFYDRAARAMDLGISFANLRPDLFADSAPILEPLAAVNVALRGAVNVKVGSGGGILGAEFDIAGGAGQLTVPLTEPVTWNIREAHAQGRIGDGGLVIESLEVKTEGPTFLAAGTMKAEGNDRVIVGTLAARQVRLDELADYWPAGIGANPRRWVTNNLSRGVIHEARTNIALTAKDGDFGSASLDSIGGAILFDGVDVEYLRPMPPLRKVNGRATFDKERFNIALTGGTLVDMLSLDEASIEITGLQGEVQDIAIDTVLQGPFRPVLEVIDHEPLAWAAELGIDPRDVSGQAALRLAFEFPLLNDLEFENVRVAAAANISQGRIENVALDKAFSEGELTLKVNKQRLDVSGTGRFGSVPVAVTWGESFVEAEIRTRLSVKGELDNDQRNAFGLALAPFVTGPIAVDMLMTGNERAVRSVVMAFDFERAGLALPDVGWTKPVGIPGAGRIRFDVVDGKVTEIKEFALSAAGLAARGEVLFDENGVGVREVSLTKFVHERNDVTGHVVRRKDGGYDVALDAVSLDLEPFMGALTGGGEATEGPDADARADAAEDVGGLPAVSATVKAEQVWVGNQPQQKLLKVEGRAAFDGELWQEVDVAANLFNGKRLTYRVDPSDKGRRLSVASNDAGALLITFGVFYNMLGGDLRVRAVIDDTKPDAPITGTIQVVDYRLVEAPTLAEVLRLASLSGIGDSLSGVGISFSRFQAPFTKTRGEIEFRKGRAAGSEIGITFEGLLDLDHGEVDLAGTIVPVYSLNSLPGNIPILGQLLVGEEGSGMFAASYRVSGDLDDPEVSVNPLAALAPGFLRGLIRFLDGSDVDPDAETAENFEEEADR